MKSDHFSLNTYRSLTCIIDEVARNSTTGIPFELKALDLKRKFPRYVQKSELFTFPRKHGRPLRFSGYVTWTCLEGRRRYTHEISGDYHVP